MKVEAEKTYQSRDGQKVGPLRDFKVHGCLSAKVDGVDRVFDASTGEHQFKIESLDLVSEWCDCTSVVGPVRERTVKEIVPGVYDRIEVVDSYRATSASIRLASRGGVVLEGVVHVLTATEITAAIEALTAIRDALVEAA